jgi:cytochrome c oxidase subunit II
VVPVNKTVRVLVTGNDVIHSFAVPSFGIITDAVPGKVNETWFKADRIGTYYGSCRELCGIDHAFMPIEVHVVSQADFDAFVAANGKPSGGAPAASPAAAPAVATVPATQAAAVPVAGAEPASPAPAAKAAEAAPKR